MSKYIDVIENQGYIVGWGDKSMECIDLDIWQSFSEAILIQYILLKCSEMLDCLNAVS